MQCTAVCSVIAMENPHRFMTGEGSAQFYFKSSSKNCSNSCFKTLFQNADFFIVFGSAVMDWQAGQVGNGFFYRAGFKNALGLG